MEKGKYPKKKAPQTRAAFFISSQAYKQLIITTK